MNRFLLLFLLVLLLSGKLFSQSLSRTHHHFGLITEKSDRYTDFVLKNTTGKKIFILRVDTDRDVSTLLSGKTLLPDSSITIRVQYNPKETGRFSKEIGIYVSNLNDPLTISISGEVRQMPQMSDLACPDFNRAPDANRIPEFELQVLVTDKITGEPIAEAGVKIIYKGLPRYLLKTDKKGTTQKKVEIGYYYFIGSAEGYKSEEFDAYINIRNNKVHIELEPYFQTKVDEWPNDSLFYKDRPDPILDPGKPKFEPLLTTEDQLLSPPDTGKMILTPTPVKETFKVNHLVFLVDVSGSMMADGKMDLLKASMIELCNTLRPEDRVTLIVYSSTARVVMENVPGNEKNRIIDKIQNMEGTGYTAGSEAMKKAYEVAQKNFIQGGNNMVIMATDGAFNLYTSDVMPTVKKYRKKGISTSIVAIKNAERDAKSMQTIALEGGGRYVPITNMEQAKAGLTEEVRTASRAE
ncbi:MAG: VWA domain-containing protein [Flavobacteriales bacterium]